MPNKGEEERVRALCNELVDKVESTVKRLGLKAVVSPQGSVAKGTWLRDSIEIDIFVLFPSRLSKRELGEIGLKVAKEAMAGYTQLERYAEHPYLECLVPFDGKEVVVDVVPCYRVKRGDWLSATDRTPFHTAYACNRFKRKGELVNQARLVKAFLRGVGVYGAEIRVQGFSGYACELLTISYGSFRRVVEAASGWRKGEVIDMEGYYKGREADARDLFAGSPLVLVDPVDKRRNVAAALSPNSLGVFEEAARRFVKKPSLRFFFPPKIKPLGKRELEKRIKEIGGNLLFLKFGRVDTKAPDVLWGQLYKTRDAVAKLLREFDFQVSRTWVWSDESEANVMLFKLESLELPQSKVHWGPPVHMKGDSDRFLRSNVGVPETVFGPWIWRGKWMVERKRKYTRATDLLKGELRDGGIGVGVAKIVAQSLRKGFEVLCDAEIWDLYHRNEGFAESFSRFLRGRPHWL